MRLLVLEDDTKLGPWIEQGLSNAGHVVDLFKDGKEALVAATMTEYDVLVLDRMVPGLDGLSVLKGSAAREDHSACDISNSTGRCGRSCRGTQSRRR